MTTIEDLESRVEALEVDMPTRKGYAAHLNDLDNKFQRFDEGQQRLEQGQQVLEQRMELVEQGVQLLDTADTASRKQSRRRIATPR